MKAAIIGDLEKLIPDWMETAVVPGLSIALINEGQLNWAKGFGVADGRTGATVTTDTIFEAASLSKPVYAYAALKLCESGVLELDRPLMDYLLPEQQTIAVLFDNIVNEPRLRQISLRHVLSHTPGFPNGTPKGENLRIHLAPGQRFSYSGAGFMFLQRVVAQVTDRDPLAFIQDSVLEPLGMTRSAFIWTEAEENWDRSPNPTTMRALAAKKYCGIKCGLRPVYIARRPIMPNICWRSCRRSQPNMPPSTTIFSKAC